MSNNKAYSTLAAIDIGTNSFHLMVANVDHTTGRFKVLDREKEIVRLGTGSTDMKHLTEAAMKRGIETLKRFKRIAEASNATTRAIATSAVREALNQSEFIRRVKKETNLRVEIASGVEEARLIYLGILQALPVFNKKVLLIDIGGGSTEFLVGSKREIHYDNSLKLGAIRLSQRFFPNDKIDSKSIKKCREFISGTLSPVVRALKKNKYEMVIGSSGTIQNIANIIRYREENSEEESLNNFTFSKESLDETLEQLLSKKNSRQRSGIGGLDPSRADIIVAGALILEQIFSEAKIKQMTVSEYALREGILFDTFEKKIKLKNRNHLNDIRYNSIIHFAESVGYEQYHSHQVAALALRIFDQTKQLHRMGETEREFLEASSLLHEVGLFLSHSQHHRHSYYMIRNAELLGFTENEKEIIANTARYHRKSHPKLKHEGFSRLSPDEQTTVTKLAAILRIADGLDRTHSSLVSNIDCRLNGNTLRLRLRKTNSSPLDMEIWGANQKKKLFEETFKKNVVIKVG